MTEPFADEHAPVDVAAGGVEPPLMPVPDRDPDTVEPEEEIVDGLPVIAEVRTIERTGPASLPAVQAAAAAATGFVAGAATIALIKRRTARKVARNGKSGPRRAVDMLPIVGSRSFLVDVHVIGKQGD
ncbi:MAG TPA: hypothetical protein VGF91_22435 [Solirubrobacteraceae bacterium]